MVIGFHIFTVFLIKYASLVRTQTFKLYCIWHTISANGNRWKCLFIKLFLSKYDHILRPCLWLFIFSYVCGCSSICHFSLKFVLLMLKNESVPYLWTAPSSLIPFDISLFICLLHLAANSTSQNPARDGVSMATRILQPVSTVHMTQTSLKRLN